MSSSNLLRPWAWVIAAATILSLGTSIFSGSAFASAIVDQTCDLYVFVSGDWKFPSSYIDKATSEDYSSLVVSLAPILFEKGFRLKAVSRRPDLNNYLFLFFKAEEDLSGRSSGFEVVNRDWGYKKEMSLYQQGLFVPRNGDLWDWKRQPDAREKFEVCNGEVGCSGPFEFVEMAKLLPNCSKRK